LLILKKFFYFWSKSKIIEKLFYYIVAYSYLLLPLCFFLSGSKKKDTIPIVIGLYGIICCLLLIYFFEMPKSFKPYFKTSYTFFEYIVFTFLFFINFRQKKIRIFIFFASFLFFLFQLFYVFTGKVKGLDTIPIGLETILILIYIIYFFYDFSKNVSTFYIYNHYGFWLAVGILIYLGGSFFFFILFDLLSKEQRNSFGNLTYLAEIIKNLLFALAIFMYARYPLENTKNKTSSIPYLDMI